MGGSDFEQLDRAAYQMGRDVTVTVVRRIVEGGCWFCHGSPDEVDPELGYCSECLRSIYQLRLVAAVTPRL